jgi:branched-chain amino acid transport system permease protein
MGSLVPLVVGAAFLVYVPQLAERISNAPGAPGVLYGAALILVMFVLPTGLGGLLRRVFLPVTSRLYART